LEPAPKHALLSRLAATSAIPVTIEVEAQAPRNHHQPGGQFASWVRGKVAQTPASVGAQLLEDKDVRVHRIVVACGDGARHVDEQP
jgi:hypothetical protein